MHEFGMPGPACRTKHPELRTHPPRTYAEVVLSVPLVHVVLRTSQDESLDTAPWGCNDRLVLKCARLQQTSAPYPRAARAARYASNASRLVLAGV